mmetsp:Transcript_39970/g.89643  ORF Transcript_39970/g.89643 Transcript_39970/m.89643 type:complete len:273 (+) Transcript_39970:1035-1853(+)
MAWGRGGTGEGGRRGTGSGGGKRTMWHSWRPGDLAQESVSLSRGSPGARSSPKGRGWSVKRRTVAPSTAAWAARIRSSARSQTPRSRSVRLRFPTALWGVGSAPPSPPWPWPSPPSASRSLAWPSSSSVKIASSRSSRSCRPTPGQRRRRRNRPPRREHGIATAPPLPPLPPPLPPPAAASPRPAGPNPAAPRVKSVSLAAPARPRRRASAPTRRRTQAREPNPRRPRHPARPCLVRCRRASSRVTLADVSCCRRCISRNRSCRKGCRGATV